MKMKSKTRGALGGLRLGLLIMAASISSAARADGENLIIAGTAPVDTALAQTVWTSTTGFPAFQGPDFSSLWASGSDANHGYIQQAVSTTAGAEHTLTFDWNVYGYFGSASGRVRALVLDADTGAVIADSGYTSAFAPAGNFAFTTWPTRTLTFTPNVSNIIVRLTGNQGIPGATNFRYPATTLVTNIVLTAGNLDTDGDGHPDDVDAFPNDPTEWADTDGDGVGDNSDAFPLDPTESVDTDGDGVGNNADACDTSDLSLTVVIGGQDTFVLNELFKDGCTITDLINKLADAGGSHGAFVSSVAHLTNDLKGSGVITNKEKAAIQKAAAQSGK